LDMSCCPVATGDWEVGERVTAVTERVCMSGPIWGIWGSYQCTMSSGVFADRLHRKGAKCDHSDSAI
ncbi:hypothetical protein TYRP_018733, partial [Tyrophagus putrescentiae]